VGERRQQQLSLNRRSRQRAFTDHPDKRIRHELPQIRAVAGVALACDETRLPLGDDLVVRQTADGRKAIIALEGALGSSQNFFRIDLQSGEQRRLTDLAGRFTIQHFDVSPDGKHIVFDRVQLNADIVVMNLAR
jgi:hypothetical protein